jgi:hypothetical protein
MQPSISLGGSFTVWFYLASRRFYHFQSFFPSVDDEKTETDRFENPK